MNYACSDRINTYLSNLALWTVKLHSLHWNVTGRIFVSLHEYTEKLYDEAFENYDAVAELLKMRDQFPLCTMAEYLKHATLKEAPAAVFTCCEVVQMVEDDMKAMRALALEIRNDAAEKDDFAAQSMFEDFVKSFDKQLWFLRAMKKEIPAPEAAESCSTSGCGCSK